MNDVIEGISFTELRSVSPDNDSKKAGDHKEVNLRIKYDGLTLKDIFVKAFSSDVVTWANGGSGRKNYDKLVNRQTIDIDARSPGKSPQLDPIDAMIAGAKAANMTLEQYVKSEYDKKYSATKA